MVKKTKENRKKQIDNEKYILILLIVSYFAGIYSGCYFVFSEKANIEFISYIADNNLFKTALYFIIALLLKYSGVLSGLLYTLPFFCGINNSAVYCNYIINDNKITYQLIAGILRDTSVLLLLIIYLILIINQVLNKKYNIKKDIKYFSVYLSGIIVISLIEHILILFIF